MKRNAAPAQNWDVNFMEYSGNKKSKLKRDLAVLKRLGLLTLPKDCRILELFCGQGECQELLCENGYNKVFGFDISEALLQQASKNYRLQVCDSLETCYKPDTFDFIFINDSLHHLKGMAQIKKCFEEVRRVLKLNGAFAFYEPANTFARKLAAAMVLSPVSYISKRLRLLKAILIEEREEYSYWLSHIPQILRLLEETGFSIDNLGNTSIHMTVFSRLKEK